MLETGKDGERLMFGFQKIGDFGKSDGNKEGKDTGKNYALSLVKEYPKGITLIVVAGMKYAAYVSACPSCRFSGY